MPVTKIKTRWVSGNLRFSSSADGDKVEFGQDGTGLDIKFYGDTPGNYMEWDQSADCLVFADGYGVASGTGSATTVSGWLKVKVGETTKYIQLYESTS